MLGRGKYFAAFFASAGLLVVGAGAFWLHGRDMARAQQAGMVPQVAMAAPIDPPRIVLPKPNNLPDIMRHGRYDRKAVALTFDDGPSPATTRKILAILAKEKVTATWFVVGSYGQRHPELLKAIHTAGHTLANHSFTHPRLTKLGPSELRAQLKDCSGVIREATGVAPHYMRPPYGAYNRAVLNEAAAQGMTVVMWGVDPKDYRKPGDGVIRDRIINHSGSGSIVLLHDGQSQTVAALPEIIAGMRKHGHTFVNLDAMAIDLSKQIAEQKAAKGAG